MQRIRNLGLAFVALGFIELAWVAFCMFGGLLLALGMVVDDTGVFALGAVAYFLLALASLPIGLLHVFTGVRLRGGRGLYLTLASIAACLLSLVMALYCSPFTLVVAVYAIVVLIDPEVRAVLDGEYRV